MVVTGTDGDDVIDVAFTGDPEGDAITNEGQVIEAGAGDDNIYDGDGDDTAYGGDGNDIIIDAVGSNYLRGGNGSDTFVFAADCGNDRIYDFELGVDTIDVSAWGVTGLDGLNIYENSGRVEIQLKSDLSEKIQLDGYDQTHIDSFGASDFVFGTGGGTGGGGGPTGDEVITGTSGDDIIDGSFAGDPEGDVITDNGDTINAGAGDDTINAGDGDDVVFGGDGRDTFFGGAGEDQYDGGAGNNDSLTYSLASQGVTVDLVDVSNNTGIAAGDTYTNIEAITGSSHDDMIVGNGSVFKLNGGTGDDVIVSGTRNNITTGGDGADTFVFNTGSKYDRIKDFNVGEDLLDVSGWGAASLADLTLDDSSGNVIVSFGTDSVRVDGITTVTDLSDSDFVFV